MTSIIKKIFVVVFCLVCAPAFCGVFSTNGHVKANGLNLQVHYPSGWSHEEGIRPHIVQKFTDKNGDYCMLIIGNTGQKLSARQWDNEFKYMTISDYKDMLEGGDVKSVKQTKYEGLSGALVQFEMSKERSGIKVYLAGLMHIFGYKDSIISMQCAAGDLTKQGARKKFEALSVDFLSFGNGLVLLNKYDSYEPEAEEYDGANIGIIIISLLAIIFAAIITIIVLVKQNSNKTVNVSNKKKPKQSKKDIS